MSKPFKDSEVDSYWDWEGRLAVISGDDGFFSDDGVNWASASAWEIKDSGSPLPSTAAAQEFGAALKALRYSSD